MTDLDKAIRERLDERRIGDASGRLEDEAIRAVLDLHPVHRLGNRAWCSTCTCTCGSGMGNGYACPTVQAIALKLGIPLEPPKPYTGMGVRGAD